MPARRKEHVAKRRLKVIQMAAEGMPRKLIADMLQISRGSVDADIEKMMIEHQAANITHLVTNLFRKQIIR